ncbi:hypothetical protein GCM10028807_17640 [Spirosoma daeguense]
MLTDQLSEEDIRDIEEVRDSLLIPLREYPTASSISKTCTCQRCRSIRNHNINELEKLTNEPPLYIEPALSGKVSTKLRR